MDGTETTLSPDPVYNRPQLVNVGGREYRIREIEYLRIMDYLGDFQRIATQADRPIQGLADLDYSELLRKFGDVFAKLIAESTGEPVEQIRNLTISDWMELADYVIQIHTRALEGFFRLAARFKAIQNSGGTSNGSARRVSSSVSSEAGSP